MNFRYDQENNVAYLQLLDIENAEVITQEVNEDLYIDFASDDLVYGIEFLNPREQLGTLFSLGESRTHGKIIAKLCQNIQNHIDEIPQGELFAGSACKIKNLYMNPDVSFFKSERISPNIGTDLPYPDLAVEVMDSGDYFFAMREKVQLYLNEGTQTVWVIFPPDQLIFVYHQNQKVKILYRHDVLDAMGVITDFKMAVSKLFE